MINKMESKIAADSEQMKRIKRAILKRLLKADAAETGCSTMDLCSLNEYGSYEVPDGLNYEFPGGLTKFLN
jgi:hypothetical protein